MYFVHIKNPRLCSVSADYGNRLMKSVSERGYKHLFVSHSHWHLNNKIPLPKRYNDFIEEAWKGKHYSKPNCDCLILCHADVILNEDPIPKLEKLFDEYDLVGVAGASKIELKSPALWHLMGGGFNSGNLHGLVHHSHDGLDAYPTMFGKHPHRAVVLDGVFLAMNRKVMEKMRFDETNPARFHFYDLDFSLNCHMNGFKVGVGDISITHLSPGLREFTEEWKNGEEWFLKKYNK